MAKRLSLSDEARQVLANWYDDSLMDDTPLYLGSFFGKAFGLFGQHAVTLNGKVHITSRAPDIDTDVGIALVGHEFYHVEEQLQHGWWGYLLAYIKGWRPAHISNGVSHPLERGAYARGSEVLRAVQQGRRERGTNEG